MKEKYDKDGANKSKCVKLSSSKHVKFNRAHDDDDARVGLTRSWIAKHFSFNLEMDASILGVNSKLDGMDTDVDYHISVWDQEAISEFKRYSNHSKMIVAPGVYIDPATLTKLFKVFVVHTCNSTELDWYSDFQNQYTKKYVSAIGFGNDKKAEEVKRNLAMVEKEANSEFLARFLGADTIETRANEFLKLLEEFFINSSRLLCAGRIRYTRAIKMQFSVFLDTKYHNIKDNDKEDTEQ